MPEPQGEFETFQDALAELRGRAAIPWNRPTKRCPVQFVGNLWPAL